MNTILQSTTKNELLHVIEWFGFNKNSSDGYYIMDPIIRSYPNIRFAIVERESRMLAMIDIFEAKIENIAPHITSEIKQCCREICIPTQADIYSRTIHTISSSGLSPLNFNVVHIEVSVIPGDGLVSVVFPDSSIHLYVVIEIMGVEGL